MKNENKPADFSAIDPAKVRVMEVRDSVSQNWAALAVLEISEGKAITRGHCWNKYRELPIKKMRPMTDRQILDFCIDKRPEVLHGGEYVPFWEIRLFVFRDLPYRLSDGTIGKFEVEE